MGAVIANALGGWDTGLQTLVILMAGRLCHRRTMRAGMEEKHPKAPNGTFESNASFRGLLRKMAILLCVLIACRVDVYTGTELARDAVILFFIANDGLSIVENPRHYGRTHPPGHSKRLCRAERQGGNYSGK